MEASKIATRKLTEEFEINGALPEERPLDEKNGFNLFADVDNARSLRHLVGTNGNCGDFLKAHLGR